MNLHRFVRASSNVTCASGNAILSTIPGNPAPDPMSMSLFCENHSAVDTFPPAGTATLSDRMNRFCSTLFAPLIDVRFMVRPCSSSIS